MEYSRLSSPPSIHVNECHTAYDRHSPDQSFSTRGPMRIPSKDKGTYAPPPLPPPRRISDFDHGHDAGWLHANSNFHEDSTKLAPISQTSSLFGGHPRHEPFVHNEKRSPDDSVGRLKAHLSLQNNHTEVKIEPPRYAEEGFRNSISTTLSEPILQGEIDFSRRSLKSSLDAYDQQLLLKIGKSNSPPRSFPGLGNEYSGGTTSLPFHLRNLPVSADGLSNGHGPSQSGAVSPRSKSGWKDYMGFRSSSVDSNAASCYETDPFGRESNRRQDSGAGLSTLQPDDTSSVASRSNRGSYDHAVFTDIESDSISDENGQFRQLQLNDRLPPYLDAQCKQQGLKRRASSPPRELTNYDRHGFQNSPSAGDSTQRRYPFLSPTSSTRFPHNHGSFSSTSSGSLRTSVSSTSYSSSLSVGASSMTSTSSGDRYSTGGISPKSELDYYQEKPVLNQSSPSSISGTTLPSARVTQFPASLESKAVSPGRKLSTQNSLNGAKPSRPKLPGMYVCDCCPKKPKKFDTAEELRAHQSEKQYSCQFCNNRFKNKNEAERHQNSLHLRRHSWSCAALSSFKSAFHSSSSPNIQTNGVASHDTCGYCGEEFANFPHPDWDRRYEHLANVHKFGDCNNIKKFYRADHFRQHLKHTHAGTTGKWTNILENACMKEEPQGEARLGSIGEEGGRRLSDPENIMTSSAISSMPTILASSTIDEAVDES